MSLIRVDKLWPSRRIPFTVSKDAQTYGGTQIATAIADWNKNTVISLIPFVQWIASGGHPAAPRIHFVWSVHGVICNSGVGYKKSGIQYVKCFQNWNVQTIVHELGHALGLYHEQQRMDRGNYVLINPVQAGDLYKANYAKKKPPYAIPDGNCDSRSVMHYRLNPPIMFKAKGSFIRTFGARRRPDGSGGEDVVEPRRHRRDQQVVQKSLIFNTLIGWIK